MNSDFQCRMQFSVLDATKDRINPIFCEVSDATVASDIRLCKQTLMYLGMAMHNPSFNSASCH
jgi:hypothetical protein